MNPRISNEARLRYRQRVNANARNVAETLRQLAERGERVETDRVRDAVAKKAGDVLVVLDKREEVVQTVLREYEYIEQGGADIDV